MYKFIKLPLNKFTVSVFLKRVIFNEITKKVHQLN